MIIVAWVAGMKLGLKGGGGLADHDVQMEGEESRSACGLWIVMIECYRWRW